MESVSSSQVLCGSKWIVPTLKRSLGSDGDGAFEVHSVPHLKVIRDNLFQAFKRMVRLRLSYCSFHPYY